MKIHVALLSIMFVGRQVEQNAKFMNNEIHDILYFEDCAVFSLNTAHAFSSIIHAVK